MRQDQIEPSAAADVPPVLPPAMPSYKELLDEILLDPVLDAKFCEHCNEGMCAENWTCFKDICDALRVLEENVGCDLTKRRYADLHTIFQRISQLYIGDDDVTLHPVNITDRVKRELTKLIKSFVHYTMEEDVVEMFDPHFVGRLHRYLCAARTELKNNLIDPITRFTATHRDYIDERRKLLFKAEKGQLKSSAFTSAEVRSLLSMLAIEKTLTKHGII
jgi:hypothetical protein